MLTEQAKEGLARILEISCPDDVKILGQKFFPSMPHNASHEEATKAILKHAQKPSEILLKQSIKIDTIVAYLEELGVSVPAETIKEDCIRMCLGRWHVKDDNFWVKPRRPNEKKVEGTYHLDKYMNRKTEQVDRDFQNKTMQILESVQEENLFHQINSQREEEEEIQILPSASVHRESPSKRSSGRFYISSRPSLSKMSEYESASLATSQVGSESTSFVDQSDSSSPSASLLERSQPISLTIPPRCASAPVRCDNQRQTMYDSKNRYSSSLGQNLSFQPLFQEPPSTEPFSLSPDSQDTIGLSSAGTMENKSSFTISPSSSSLSSNRISKTKCVSPEPPSSSLKSMKTVHLPLVGVVESEDRSFPVSQASSYLSYRGICKAEPESPERTRTPTSKPLVHIVSVSNASIQTLPSEFPEIQYNRSVSQTNAGHEWSTQKELLPNKVKSYKQGLLKRPLEERTIFHHKSRNDSPSLPKRNDNNAGISAAKRNRWASSPCPKDFRNGSQSTVLECPNCEEKYCLSFHRPERSESDVLPRAQSHKKKHPSTLSKDSPSSEKRRVTLQSKRVKTYDSFLSSRKSSTKTGTLKRKCSILSPGEKTLSHEGSRRQPTSSKQPRYTSAISSENHKKSKISIKNANYDAVVNPGNEDRDSSESSTDCLPPDNPIDINNDAISGSSSVPSELPVSEAKLNPKDSASDISDEDLSTESPSSPMLEKPLPRPKRHCCTLM